MARTMAGKSGVRTRRTALERSGGADFERFIGFAMTALWRGPKWRD